MAAGAVGAARARGAHIVLTTYGYSRRGVSLVEMTALVLATPRRNGGRQLVGRILRRGSDQSIVRQIVDVVDVSTGLGSQRAARAGVYAAKGYPVHRVAVAWDDPPLAPGDSSEKDEAAPPAADSSESPPAQAERARAGPASPKNHPPFGPSGEFGPEDPPRLPGYTTQQLQQMLDED